GGAGAPISADQRPLGRPPAVRAAARRLRHDAARVALNRHPTRGYAMRNLTPATMTKAFAEYSKKAPNKRTRTLMVSLASHLHRFVRENKVTQEEWLAGIDAITRATKFTDDKRNEYILFSDLLGVSSLVDMVNALKGGTPSSVLGPFHIEGAPEIPNGGDL